MASEAIRASGVSDSGGSERSFDQLTYNAASSTRALTTGLAGTCVAILTFVLFFLYPRWTGGEVNNLLFQWALTNIVVTLFLTILSAILYWLVIEAVLTNHPLTPRLSRGADLLFLVGAMLLALEPALILFTVAIYFVATVALALWLTVLVILGLAWRWFR